MYLQLKFFDIHFTKREKSKTNIVLKKDINLLNIQLFKFTINIWKN